LPTPKPHSNDRQETKYVIYNSSTTQGGIERFKTGRHGEKEKLNFSIMLGYIQEFDSEYWFAEINNWIANQIKMPSNPNLTWTIEDLLDQDNSYQSSKVAKYKSSHLKEYRQFQGVNFAH
jgi:hypothetical protein